MRRPIEEFSRLTKSHAIPAEPEDIDLPTLGRALWRAKGWILGLASAPAFSPSSACR